MYISRTNKLICLLWGKVLSFSLNTIGKNTFISPKAKNTKKRYVSFGSNCRVGANVRMEVVGESSRVEVGSKSIIQYGVVINTYGGVFKIGSNCSFKEYVILVGPGDVTIGNDVRIGPKATIVAGNHKFDSIELPIRKQRVEGKGIIIENDCWIGSNTVILDGIRIVSGAVIADGAIVTKTMSRLGFMLVCRRERLKVEMRGLNM